MLLTNHLMRLTTVQRHELPALLLISSVAVQPVENPYKLQVHPSTDTMHNGNSGFLIRRLKRRDREDLISNYYALYNEVKHNPSLGISLLRRKPSINEEYKWFAGGLPACFQRREKEKP